MNMLMQVRGEIKADQHVNGKGAPRAVKITPPATVFSHSGMFLRGEPS